MQYSEIISYFRQLVTSLHNWYALGGFAGSATGISILLELMKPRLKSFISTHNADIERAKNIIKQSIVTFLGLTSFTVSIVTDYINSDHFNLSTVTGHAAWIASLALAIYHFGGSKLYTRIRKYASDIEIYLDEGILPGGTPKS